ncbi:MAG TPA: hypothetical protein VF668_02525 [Pyrinomonadaceae bacterium]|jgi:hypothetical protein
MGNRIFALGLALLLTLSHAAHASAATPRAADDWSAVQALTPGEKIVVRTKDGDRLTGRFDSATDLLINFTDGRKKISLTRESLRRVQLDRGNSRLSGMLVGAAIGGGGGAAVGGWVYSQGDFIGSVVPAGALLGAGIGAAIGAATGKGRKNVTVYEAP